MFTHADGFREQHTGEAIDARFRRSKRVVGTVIARLQRPIDRPGSEVAVSPDRVAITLAEMVQTVPESSVLHGFL